jgi:formylglycine-generating enzyme required for sulfatase activity
VPIADCLCSWMQLPAFRGSGASFPKTVAFRTELTRSCHLRSSPRTRLTFWVSLVVVCMSLLAAAHAQPAATRIALIIGNSNYPDAGSPLATTANDARTLADEFRLLNFNVELKENLKKDEMQRTIDAFVGKVTKDTEAIFYFSGFGLQVDRRTYLLPVNAQIWNEADVRRDGISIDLVVAEMHRRGAKVTVVIIDAARRNPFERRFRATPAGLAALEAPEGTLALYSAAPGVVLRDSDNAKPNSVFVAELVKELRSPNQTAEQAFNLTRIGVSRASNNEIVPWVASSLLEEFYFQSSRQSAAGPPPQPAPPPPRIPPAPAAIEQPTPPPPAPPPPASAPPSPPTATEARRVAPVPVQIEAGRPFQDCSTCPELVLVPAGSFTMGGKSEDDRPAHRVAIKTEFAIGRHEITFEQWDKCVEEGACKAHPGDRNWGRGKRPVINVSWLDAKAFASWLSQKTGQKYRLPTEAEWEYAARAGTTTTYWWGQEAGSRQANCQNCNSGDSPKTLPVGSFKPNPFGIYDTSGNVAEWVEDCWHADYKSAPTDGSAWSEPQCQLRVLRGGAYDSDAIYVSSSSRFRYDYDVPYSSNGFRLVREVSK